MRAVIQRVKKASVEVENKIIGEIEQGYMILVGIVDSDSEDDIEWLSNKIVNLRLFDDSDGVMNRSLLDIEGSILVVSQFTLHAKTKKGNRPSYIGAAKPEISIPIYEHFKSKLSNKLGKSIESGEFGADMQVTLQNDGPVTIIIDTKSRE